jgi:hypothetical protein
MANTGTRTLYEVGTIGTKLDLAVPCTATVYVQAQVVE